MQSKTPKKLEAITKELKNHPNGIWMEKLINILNKKHGKSFIYDHHHLSYYLFGFEDKNGKFWGGYLKDKIIEETEGRNRKIRLKKNK